MIKMSLGNHANIRLENKIFSPQSRRVCRGKFSVPLPVRGPAKSGYKHRQMRNNQPAAENHVKLL